MKDVNLKDMQYDNDYPRFKKIKHVKNYKDEDFRYEKFRKGNKTKRNRGFDY